MTRPPSRQLPRATLVAEMQERLASPRRDLLMIVSAAGACAFLFAVVSLWAGLDSMAVRYFLATTVGYLVFVGLLRVWIGIRRDDQSSIDITPDFLLDAVEVSSSPRPTMFSGGQSGGGGAGGTWDSNAAIVSSRSASTPVESAARNGSGVDFDLDAGWWVLAAVLAGSAFVAIGFVIYSAPVLLAEIALDAAVVSAIYARLRDHERGYWLGAAVRRTWFPAVVVIVFMTAAGYALQQAMPDAQSIGDIFR